MALLSMHQTVLASAHAQLAFTTQLITALSAYLLAQLVLQVPPAQAALQILI